MTGVDMDSISVCVCLIGTVLLSHVFYIAQYSGVVIC